MRKLMSFLMTLVLLVVVSATAMAGDTQGPSNPGETNSPPGETNGPPGQTSTPPGEVHTPGVMSILLSYWLGLD